MTADLPSTWKQASRPPNNPPVTNVDRLQLIAAALRERGLPGDEHTAAMVEACEPIAIYWTEPYASPFVPLLQHALRLGTVLGVPGLVRPTTSNGAS